MYLINDKEFKCSVEVTLDIFNDKWKLAIIWHLLQEDKRFKDLNEAVCGITQKTLTVKLKDLEEKNLINREVFAQVPPKVVYSLTPMGKLLKPVVDEMYKWGRLYVKEYGEINEESTCDINYKT